MRRTPPNLAASSAFPQASCAAPDVLGFALPDVVVVVVVAVVGFVVVQAAG